MAKIKNVALGILGWGFGLLFFIAGLGTLFSNFVAGLAIMIAGLVLIPNFLHFIRERAHISLSPTVRAIIFVVGFMVFGATGTDISSPPTQRQPRAETQKVAVQEDVQNEPVVEQPVDEQVQLNSGEPTPEPTPEPVEPPKPKTLGVSYAQVLQHIGDFFKMEKTEVLVDGKPKYLGQSELALLEIIGDKRDVTQASVVIFLPSDNPNAVIQNTALVLRFMQNVMPDWPGREDWINKAVKDVQVAQDGKVETTHNGKRIQVIAILELGMMTFTVESM